MSRLVFLLSLAFFFFFLSDASFPSVAEVEKKTKYFGSSFPASCFLELQLPNGEDWREDISFETQEAFFGKGIITSVHLGSCGLGI